MYCFFLFTPFSPLIPFFIIFRAVVLLTADYWINNKILSPTVLLNGTWKMMVKFQSSTAITSFDKIRICIVFRRRMTLSNICDRALCKNVCKNGQKKNGAGPKKKLLKYDMKYPKYLKYPNKRFSDRFFTGF